MFGARVRAKHGFVLARDYVWGTEGEGDRTTAAAAAAEGYVGVGWGMGGLKTWVG